MAALVTPPALGDEPLWRVHVDLVDGSRIIGTPFNKSLKVDVGFAALDIPLQRIRVAEWKEGGKTVRVEMVNDDTITGTVTDEPVEVAAIFGNVTLAMKHIKSLQVRPAHQLGWLPTQQGLELYYPFDRVGDGVVTNHAGEWHTAKLNDAKWTDGGVRGGAIEFTGSARIEVPHHQNLCPQSLTLAAWLKPTGTQGAYKVIAAKTSDSSWYGGYGFVRMPGDEKNVYFFVNGYTDSVVKAEIPSDKWSHVAGVCDGTSVKIFVNGKAIESVKMPVSTAVAAPSVASPFECPSEDSLDDSPPHDSPKDNPTAASVEGSQPKPLGPGAQPIRHTTSPLCIGSDLRGYAWSGFIDELVLYGRALSDREVEQLFESVSVSD
ncbi:MAG: LamG domain-containing protein [Verrucomicrobiales bacterium]